MDFLIKNRLVVLALVAIIALFFLLRLPNLTSQPIFADEAIYIRWSQLMKSESTLRFISMTDGKTPLYMWVLMPFLRLIEDPLYAARLLSILSGFMTLLGVVLLSWQFFNKRAALWAGLIVAIAPFMVFFDRMALVDSMLTAFILWTLLFVLALQRHPRLDLAMIGGFLAGGSILVKTPGVINLYLLPVSFLGVLTILKNKKELLKRIGALFLVFLIAQVVFNLLRLGPGFENLNARDQDYVYSVREIISHPLNPLSGNIERVMTYFYSYLGIPLMLSILWGALVSLKGKDPNACVVMLWGVSSVLIAAALIKPFTARYILFAIPPLLIIAAIGVDDLYQNRLKRAKIGLLLLAVLISAYPLYFSSKLLTDPYNTPLPPAEFTGYFREWTAGVGYREIAYYLKERTQEGTVVVGTEGSFGTLPDGLQIYFDKNPMIVFQGGKAEITQGLRIAALDHQAYFVANKSRFDAADVKGLELIKEYSKPSRNDGVDHATLFFKVYPLKEASSSAK